MSSNSLVASTAIARCAALCLFAASGASWAELPVACAPCTVNSQAFQWKAPGSGSEYLLNGPNAVVKQALDRETFNWQSFNIGAGNSLEFRQPGTASIALNRIFQGDPSQIFGALKANGQVYLINQNGILFKPGANVDVNTLLASSLQLNSSVDNLIEDVGITNVLQEHQKAALSTNGAPGTPGAVVVERGATLKARENGRVILIGGDVTNAGHIESSGPGGQVILAAAKDEAYLFLPQDPQARGLAVEVATGGMVENLGEIVAKLGNATLAGLAVNQRGVVRATSAVDVNGSIRLQARDTVSRIEGSGADRKFPVMTRGGDIEFAAGSITEVTIDPADPRTAVDDQETLPSTIDLVAKDIVVRGGARLAAAGGRIVAEAKDKQDPTQTATAGSIRIERGAVLDVAGTRDVPVPVARNVVSIELRGAQLADVPVQRDGPLAKREVSFDIRRPLPSIANVSPALATIQRTAAERSATGGEISLTAAADVTVEAGSVLDVSGGSVRYQPGFIRTSKLITEGRVVDISDADPEIVYDALLGPLEFEHFKWGAGTTETFFAFGPGMQDPLSGFDPGYLEGKDAGRIAINALRSTVAGRLIGETVRGPFQRKLPGSATGFSRPHDELPRGGQLALTAAQTALRFTAADFPLEVPGFSELALTLASYQQAAGTALALPVGGQFTVNAGGQIVVDGEIRIPSGTLTLTSNKGQPSDAGSIRLGPDASLDVRGTWVRDEVNADPSANLAPLAIDGGSVTLDSTGELRLAAGSRLDVGGGAFRNAAGDLDPGDGGRLTLTADTDRRFVTASPEVMLDGSLRGFTFTGAGRPAAITVSIPEVRLSARVDDALPAGTHVFLPQWFADSGFGRFSLRSNERGLRVSSGTELNLLTPTLSLVPGAGGAFTGEGGGAAPASGSELGDFTVAGLPDPILRAPSSITLEATLSADEEAVTGSNAVNTLVLEAGSRIATDVGGAITLNNKFPIVVAGQLAAPAGTIKLTLNPLVNETRGFDNERAIWLLPGAALSAAGALVASRADDFGRITEVAAHAGGSVELTAGEGYVVAFPGASIDVSGISGSVDITLAGPLGRPEFREAALASDAGRIAVSASNGIQFYADLDAHGAADLGARGGNLALHLDGNLRRDNLVFANAPLLRFPETPQRLQIGDTAFPAAFTGAGTISNTLFGFGGFELAELSAGGFAALSLAATPHEQQKAPPTASNPLPLMEARIEFIGDFALRLPGSIRIAAPILQSDGGSAAIAAPYLALGFTNERFVTSDTPQPFGQEPTVKYFSAEAGTGRATFDADLIDLTGFLALRRFGGSGNDGQAVQLRSTGDIRLRGIHTPVEISRTVQGALNVATDLLLSARRIYPSTLTDFTILNELSGGTVRIAGGGNEALPLSAAGKVAIRADRILQDGSLLAPFGTIELDAATDLRLGASSLTSVTGVGTQVLFGRTQVGDWVFPFAGTGPGIRVFDADVEPLVSELPPAKRIVLRADGTVTQGGTPIPTGRIDIRPGARIDVRRGGALVATEFLPGPFGTVDLVDVDLANGAFAILPTQNDPIAPFDPAESPAFEYAMGTRFTIDNASTSGLAAGTYTVLPPRYALLPGGYLLSPASVAAGELSNNRFTLTTTAGLPVVSGDFQENGQTTTSPLATARFQVENSARLRNRAEYEESFADSFFSAQAARRGVPAPLLPRDAGTVTIAANASLLLGGTVVADQGVGRGSRVDIAAKNIVITEQITGRTDAIELTASGLEQLGAESLLVGGSRSLTGEVVTLDTVEADSVEVLSGVELSLPEVMLVASDRVAVASGAKLRGVGSRQGGRQTLEISGDNAVIAATRNPLPALVRAAVPTNAGAVAEVAAGAQVFGSGGVIVDSTGNSVVAGQVATAAGGGLRFGANRIALGDAPAGAPGLTLSSTTLAQLGVSLLELASDRGIDIYGDFTLNFVQLLIDAAGLRGLNAGATVAISATSLTLQNSTGGQMAPAPGSGTLALSAGTLNFGPAAGTAGIGDFNLDGFDTVAISAGQLIATADHMLAADAAVVTIDTDLIAATAGSALTIASSGALATRSLNSAATGARRATDFLGGEITLTADQVSHGARIFAPGGGVSVQARNGTLELTPGAVIDAAGLSNLDFRTLAISTPGGTIDLRAEAGDIAIGANALLAVSAGAGDTASSAGTLRISAPAGSIRIADSARLAGTRAAAADGARAEFDAGDFAGSGRIAGINTLLNAGGFDAARSFRVRDIDLEVAVTDIVTAREIRLVADAGDVKIAGQLNASGVKAGTIDVLTNGVLTLEPTAQLLALATGGFLAGDATPASPRYTGGYRGGRITFAAPTGELQLNGGTINVSGTRVDRASGSLIADPSGRVQLLAPRGGPAGVSITNDGLTIVGAEDVAVIGLRSYTPAQAGTIVTDGSAFSATAGTILNNLNLAGMPAARVGAGVEIRAAGDLSLGALGVNFDALFDAAQVNPGWLAIRAGEDLTVTIDLRDGSINDLPDGNALVSRIADSNRSWTLQLTAGADLGSADFRATGATPAILSVGAGRAITTGSGDLRLAASGDIKLGQNTTILAIGRHLDPVNFRGTIIDNFFVAEDFDPPDQGLADIFNFIFPSAVQRFLRGVSYPEAGGNIEFRAGGAVIAERGDDGPGDWVHRIGGEDLTGLGDVPRTSGLYLDGVRNAVAAFGGGNVTVEAGADIVGGMFSIGSFERQIGSNSYDKQNFVWTTTSDVTQQIGGGDLRLTAAGAIAGVDVHVARGTGLLRAADDIGGNGNELPRIMLGDAQVQLETAGDAVIGTVVDPSVLPLALTNPSAGAEGFATLYFSYTNRSSLALTAGGTVTLKNQKANESGLEAAFAEYLNFYPGNVSAIAVSADVILDGHMNLFPTATGTLSLIAGNSIRNPRDAAQGRPLVLQLDSDPALFAPRVHPAPGEADADIQRLFIVGRDDSVPIVDHARTPVHLGDPVPNRLIALAGDLSNSGGGGLALVLAKPVYMDAGRDLLNLDLLVQNLAGADISTFIAGRDLVLETPRLANVGSISSTSFGLALAGPGEFQILAGGEVDLGTANGIRSVGDNFNRALADTGGDVTILSGLVSAPAWGAFIDRYLDEGTAYDRLLAQFLNELAASGRFVPTPGQSAPASFEALPAATQQHFLLDVFFSELRDSGVAASDPANPGFQDFSRGFEAVETLFPGSDYAGDVVTPLSTVQIQDGGTLRLLVPGGLVDAGLTSTAGLGGGAQFKADVDLGYIVFRRGNFQAFVRDDFNVNSTRVFAQQGGDVLIWSSEGDIDAGRGAKTAASIPITEAIFDEFGNFVNEPPLAVSGSGIRNFAPPGTPAGTLFLFAPLGVINAGDAGIGSAGNIVLGATEVIGADNIDIGGVAIGVPTADTGGIAAGLTGVGDVAASATRATEKATADAAAEEAAAAAAAESLQQGGMSIISVKVLGFGA